MKKTTPTPETEPSDECYTLADDMRRVRDVLRKIDLDPASCAHAQRVVRAVRFFTKAQNGLSKRWRGRVWMNCPFSNPKPWVIKLLASFNAGDVVESVSVFNSRTGSQWFDLMSAQAWRCECRKRRKFWGPWTNDESGGGKQDHVFFYLGPNPERFAAVFGEVGRIIPPTPSVTEGVTFCEACTRPLIGLRADATTCGARCRKRKQRMQAAA